MRPGCPARECHVIECTSHGVTYETIVCGVSGARELRYRVGRLALHPGDHPYQRHRCDRLAAEADWIGVINRIKPHTDFKGEIESGLCKMMAIGMGKMFGFEFMENFNYPYVAESIRDFWRRWHISLSTWLRDYLYVPLGGNRRGSRCCSAVRWILA